MKLTTLFCLVALISAATAATAADKAAAAPAAAATGYEAAPETYEAAPVAYAHVQAPEVCLGGCPRNAPCQHPSGGCMPKSCYRGGYEGGRRLQDNYAGAEYAGETYAAPVAAYAPPAQCGCPAGTKDVWGFSRLNKRVTLWVAFALLIAPALFFFYKAWERDDSNSVSNDQRLHRVVAGGICFIASLAYLTMSLGYGYTIRCCDGREFYYARYVDWAITTPMMLWELIHLNRKNGGVKGSERTFMYSVDFLMIISGLIGALICHTVLDIISKSVFGWIIVNSPCPGVVGGVTTG